MTPEFSLFQDVGTEKFPAQIVGIRFDFNTRRFLYQLFIFNQYRVNLYFAGQIKQVEEDYASLLWFDAAQIQKLKEIHAI